MEKSGQSAWVAASAALHIALLGALLLRQPQPELPELVLDSPVEVLFAETAPPAPTPPVAVPEQPPPPIVPVPDPPPAPPEPPQLEPPAPPMPEPPVAPPEPEPPPVPIPAAPIPAAPVPELPIPAVPLPPPPVQARPVLPPPPAVPPRVPVRPRATAPRPAASVPTAASSVPFVQPSPVAPPAPAPVPSTAPSVEPGWRAALGSWLASHKRYPEQARQRGDEGTVGVRFTVDATGRVTDVAITRSSGSSLLDEAVRDMLAGQRVPPFPAGMTQAQMTVPANIRFQLER